MEYFTIRAYTPRTKSSMLGTLPPDRKKKLQEHHHSPPKTTNKEKESINNNKIYIGMPYSTDDVALFFAILPFSICMAHHIVRSIFTIP